MAALCSVTACATDAGSAAEDFASVTSTASVENITLAQPLTDEEAPDLAWHYVEFSDSRCRNGTAAGIKVRRNKASSKLLIYLEGGGACFNAEMCNEHNPASVQESDEGAPIDSPYSRGLFNLTRSDNPVRDWNLVYVPYCTGDLHAGTTVNTVPGVPDANQSVPQYFYGRLNLEKFLGRVVPTFPSLNQLVLAGRSAGGGATVLNAPFVKQAFGAVPFNMVNDSGPMLSGTLVPPCQQSAWKNLWGLGASVLAECGASCPDHSNYGLDLLRFALDQLGGRKSGFIASDSDVIVRAYYGAGYNNGARDCGGSASTLLCADEYAQELLQIRSQFAAYPNFRSIYLDTALHTFLYADDFYIAGVNGVALRSWFIDVLNNANATITGPQDVPSICLL